MREFLQYSTVLCRASNVIGSTRHDIHDVISSHVASSHLAFTLMAYEPVGQEREARRHRQGGIATAALAFC